MIFVDYVPKKFHLDWLNWLKTCTSNDDFAWCPFLDVNVYFIGHTHKRLSIGKLDSKNQVS